MNADEVLLIRDIRRMFDKVPIDSSRMEVSLQRGHITLSGTVKNHRSHPLVSVKESMEDLERRIRRDQRVKLLSIECRLIQAEKKAPVHFEAEHFTHDTEAQSDEEAAVEAPPA